MKNRDPRELGPDKGLTTSGEIRSIIREIETAWGEIARIANTEQQRLGPTPTWDEKKKGK